MIRSLLLKINKIFIYYWISFITALLRQKYSLKKYFVNVLWKKNFCSNIFCTLRVKYREICCEILWIPEEIYLTIKEVFSLQKSWRNLHTYKRSILITKIVIKISQSIYFTEFCSYLMRTCRLRRPEHYWLRINQYHNLYKFKIGKIWNRTIEKSSFNNLCN
jgi:hypothetical protein